MSVPLASRTPLVVDLPHLTAPEITTRLTYEGPLIAPIAKGETVAELEVSFDSSESYTVPLAAMEDVAEASFLRRIWNGLVGWFV